MNKMNTILFLPSNSNHVQIFSRISEILKKDFRVLFLTQGSFKNEGAEEYLSKLGINFKKIDDYEKTDPKFIIDKENVRLLVIGNDTDVIPQWFVNYCNDNNIPSVLIQDGVQFHFKKNIQKSYMPFFKEKNHSNYKLQSLALKLKLKKHFKKISYGLGNCTQIHVWGNSQKDHFVKNGSDKNCVFVTGYLLSDKIQKITSSKSRIVLYAPSDLVFSKILSINDMKKIVSTVYSAIGSLDNVRLLVKPHPRENLSLFENIENKPSCVTVSNDDFFELLAKSSLVISDISSTILEALLSGKHVIVFFPQIHQIVDSNSFPLDLIQDKVIPLAQDKTELSDCIKNLLEKKDLDFTSKQISTFFGPMDGKESARSAKLIADLINE